MAITYQFGGKTLRPPGAFPAMKREGSFLGSHNQSTILSEKCNPSAAIRCHHVEDIHSGTIIVAFAPCDFSFLHFFPIRLGGVLINQLSKFQSNAKPFTPDVPLHQWREYNLSRRLFSFVEKISIVWGPHLKSNMSKKGREIEESSGINHLEISSAKALASRWTHPIEIMILC